MECFITHCIIGFIAIDENNNIIKHELFDDINSLIKLEKKELVNEEIKLIEELSDSYDMISIESQSKKSNYSKWNNVKVEFPNKAGKYLRENLDGILTEIGFSNKEEFADKYRKLASYKIKNQLNSEDRYLVQAINSIDDMDESISKLAEKLRDWYSLYFPELDIVQNNKTYVKLIALNDNKKEIVDSYNNDLLKYDEFEEDINEKDLDIIKNLAKSIYSLQITRENTENYIEEKMESLAPNLNNLVGSSLGAKLISHAGSLEKLASYPSGTVQIMGAEKALFRHLKTGENPPKHGLIFQHPQVRTNNWWLRGKIAKKLSLKISLATRKDVYTKKFDLKINEEFLKEVEQIKKDNPFPPRPKRKNKDSKKRKIRR